jgi:hypothetical protein
MSKDSTNGVGVTDIVQGPYNLLDYNLTTIPPKPPVFDKLSKIDVGDKTEKKGNFTYLSWAFAWSELKKVAPDAIVRVYEDPRTGLPYFGAGDAGVMVKVGVTVNGLEHINYLPAMNFSNKAIPEDKVNMMDVNKAIQRATVKAIALHGLGLYIYAGEDLPEAEGEPKEKAPPKKAAAKAPAKKAAAPKKSGGFRNKGKKDDL